MGSTFQADIPGNRHNAQIRFTASAASDGAAARNDETFSAPQNIEILGATWTPTGADQGAHAASYRRITLVNGAVVLSSINMTASIASFSSSALSGTATLADGAIVAASQVTVGGDHATGTVFRAGTLDIEYRYI